MAVVCASAADTSGSSSGAGSTIYFDASGWENVETVYCHIWKRGGEAFYTWQSKKELCKSVGDNIWAYDSPTLKSGEDYYIIFSCNTGKQTYECTFGTPCFGDTLKLTGNKVENPVDSEKKADEAVWTKSSSYGPHLAFTSIGNIVGKYLCPNEKGTEVIGDWLPTYYLSRYVNDKVSSLANAYPVFGIKSKDDIAEIYNYILRKKTGEDQSAMSSILWNAFAKAYPPSKGVKIDTKKAKSQAESIESIKKSGGHVTSSSNHLPNYYVWELPAKGVSMNIGQSFKIKTGTLVGKRKFSSTNKKVVSVSKKGKVVAKKSGKAKIKVKVGVLNFVCKIKVRTPKISKKKLTLKVKQKKKLKVKNYNKKVKWKSSNKKIATVNSKGLVKAIKRGKATITASIKGKKFKCKLTVKNN
jgi:hypothetical protein